MKTRKQISSLGGKLSVMMYEIKTAALGSISEDEFYYFCQENDSLNLERNPNGNFVVNEPSGVETDGYNMDIVFELKLWNRKTHAGQVLGNNAGFTLPNKAVRSPDAAFIQIDRWNRIPARDRKKFAHICPDFVIELLSESDSTKAVHEKMLEWISNGCKLAWLINPKKREVKIYRSNGEIVTQLFSKKLTGEDILPGFAIHLNAIFPKR